MYITLIKNQLKRVKTRFEKISVLGPKIGIMTRLKGLRMSFPIKYKTLTKTQLKRVKTSFEKLPEIYKNLCF